MSTGSKEPPKAPGSQRPAAPPVYWPQHALKALQTKTSAAPTPPPVYPAIQAKLAPHVQAAIHRVSARVGEAKATERNPAQAKLGSGGLPARQAAIPSSLQMLPPAPRLPPARSPAVLQRASLSGKQRVGNVFDVDGVAANSLKSLTARGWAKTTEARPTPEPAPDSADWVFIAIYRKGGATIRVYIDQTFKSGRIFGVYNNGAADSQPSWIEFVNNGKGTMEQNDMHSYPQGQGIATVLSYEGAVWAKANGFGSVKTSIINRNSAKLADTLSATTPLLSGQGSSSSSSSSSSCWSGCFLSTACAEARGLPYDCEELTILRGFRDGYMRETGAREALVDLYYEIAPRIVDAIRASADAQQVLDAIYLSITECVRLIKAQELERAFALYEANVAALAGRFLPELNPQAQLLQ